MAGAKGTRSEPLRRRHRSRAVSQVLGAEKLAPDRAGNELVETGAQGTAAEPAGKQRAEGGTGDGGSLRQGPGWRRELNLSRGPGPASRAAGGRRLRASYSPAAR